VVDEVSVESSIAILEGVHEHKTERQDGGGDDRVERACGATIRMRRERQSG